MARACERAPEALLGRMAVEGARQLVSAASERPRPVGPACWVGCLCLNAR
jgi:hypothetical protein